MQSIQFKKPQFTLPVLMSVICVLLLITRLLVANGGGDELSFYISIILCQICVFALPASLYGRVRGLGGRDIGLKLFPLGSVPLLLAALGLLIIGCSLLRFGIFYIGYDASSYNIYGTVYTLDLRRAADVVYTLFAFALLPAVTEEIVFRGIVFSEYRKSGAVFSMLISSLLFALLHFDPIMIPVYFFAGIIISWVVLLTGSVIASTVVHFLFNIFSLFFQKYIWAVSAGTDSEKLFWWIMVLLFVLFTLLFISAAEGLLRTKGASAELPPEKETKFGKACAEAFGSVTFIMFIFVYAATLLFTELSKG